MKICLCIDELNSGGAERVIATLANEFFLLNYDVVLIETSSRDSTPFYALFDGLPHLKLLKEQKHKINFFKKVKLLKKVLKAIKPDAVISFKYQTNVLCYFATKHSRIAHIVSERNNPFIYCNGFVMSVLKKYVFKHSSGCVFQTEDALKYYFKKKSNKTAIIPNPVFVKTTPIEREGYKNHIVLTDIVPFKSNKEYGVKKVIDGSDFDVLHYLEQVLSFFKGDYIILCGKKVLDCVKSNPTSLVKE